MKTAGDPPRLRQAAAPGSALQRGLEVAHGRGPTDEQLRNIERRLLTSLGVAGALSLAAKAKAASASASAGWLSAGAAKVVVGVALTAVVSGGAVGVWRAARPPARRQPPPAAAGAPPARARTIASAGAVAGTREPAIVMVPSPPPAEPVAAATPPALAPAPPVVGAPRVAAPPAVGAPRVAAPPAVGAPRVAAAPPVTARGDMGSVISSRPRTTTPSLRAAVASAPPPPDADALRAPVAADDGEELRLLARAHRALPADPALALALAAEHQRRFPNGSMDQEREIIRGHGAGRFLGRTPEARLRAERFARDHADSAYVGRIRSILAAKRVETIAP